MINAQLHDGTILQFPDGTPDEVVNNTVKNFLQAQADPYADERTLVGSVSEFGKGIARGFTGSFLSAGEGLAELADAGANFVGLDDLIDSGDENELVRLAREGREAIDSSALGGDVAYRDQWFTKFGEGVGSLASFFTPAGAVKLAGLAGKAASGAQLAGGLTLAGGAGAGEQAQRIQAARDQGLDVSEAQEDASIGFGTLVGFSELAPVAGLLRKISRTAPKQVQDNIKSRLLSGLKSGGFEGLQEVTANIAQNAIERGIYNENLAVDDSIAGLLKSDEFTVGAASGFVADMVLTSIALRRNRYASQAEKDREAIVREDKAERISRGEQAVSDLQAAEQLNAEQRAQEEQGLDFQPSQATVDPSQIDAPTPEQITKKLRRGGRYLEVIDSTDPENIEAYQAEEKVRRRKVKGNIVETRYVVDINADGTTQEKIISKNGVPNPAISVQELAPPSEKFQPQSKPNPPKDYANHIYRVLGRSFPTAGSFQVDMPDSSSPSVAPNQVVHVTPDGKKTPFGRNVQSFEEASIIAGRLNDKIIDSQVNNSVTQVINNSTESYSPEVKSTLVAYGDTILHPNESTFTASAIDSAAETTIAQGFQENASAKDLVTQGVSQRKMTASQKLNAKRIAKGLPETNTFTPAEAKSVLKDKFSRLIRPPETLENAIYKAVARKNKKKKDEFVLVSGNGDTITERPPTKTEALEQLDKVGGRRRDIKFATIQEARAYAKEINAKEKIFVHSDSVLERGSTDAKLSVVADALRKNNITNDVGSPEIRALAENFTGVKATGNRRISDMNQGELKALVSGIRSLPRFDVPTKIPLFKHNRYTSDQFGAALEFVKQNDNDTTNTMGIAQAIGLDPMTDPQALKVAESLAADLKTHITPLKTIPKTKPETQEEVLLLESPAPNVDINKLTAMLKSRLGSFGLKDIALNLDYALRNVSRNNQGQLVFGVRQGQRKDDSGELMFDSSGNLLMGAKREGVDERTEAFYSPDVNGIFLAVDTVSGIKDMTPEQQEAEFVRLLDHEMIHGMRQLDLWTEKEWQLLSSLVSKKQSGKGGTFLENAQRDYSDRSKVVQMEEAVAEMTREARASQRLLTGKPRALTNRIKEFFTKTKNAINGFGFNSFDNIVKGIESGEIGSRERGQVRTLLETERATETLSFNPQSQARPIVAQRDEREAVPVQGGQRKGDFEGVDATISEADTQAQSDFVESDILESRTIPDSDVPASSVLQFAPYSPAVDSASTYAQDFGLEYFPPDRHVLANPERGAEIAEEYEIMEHNPNDPLVASAYQALVDETLSQYEYLLRTGLKVEMMGEQDPYGGLPSNAIKDIKRNNHLYVFPTSQGYGPENQSFSELQVSEFPLLAKTQFTDVNGVPMLANDVFRAVHDFYGHVKSGTTFRATGEENAWQNHSAMYSPLARRAMTTETRGQNSWVNFGPFSESNKNANLEGTRFAVQKTGLMPVWTSEENRVSANARQRRFEDNIRNTSSGLEGAVKDNGRIDLVHYATSEFQRSSPSRWGKGLSRNTRAERNRIESGGIGRTYFGVESGVSNRYRKESGLGNFKHTAEVDASLLYDYNTDPEGFYKGTQLQQNRDYNSYEKLIRDSGYIGYFVNDPQLGTTVAVFDPLVVETQKISSKEKAKDSLSEGFVPKSTIPEIPERAIEEVVKDNVRVAKSMPKNQVPEFNVQAEPRSQYVAQNPEKGAKLSIEDNNMYSRKNEPQFSARAEAALSGLTKNTENSPASTAYLDVTNTSSIGEKITRLKAKAINKWARLEDIHNKQFRGDLADTSAIAAALFSDRSRGISSEALKNGYVSYKNGITKVEKFVHNGKEYRGLIDVMAPLFAGGNKYHADLERLAQGYAIAKRSERLKAEGKAVPADATSLADIQSEVNKYTDENGKSIVEEWYKAWSAYNAKTVEFLMDTGVLDAETAETWIQQSDYVPFYRQAEDPDAKDKMPKIFSGMTSASTFKALKGGETAITVPLLDAITRNLDSAISMGMRNVAQQRIVRDMNSLGLAKEVKAGQSGNNVISFRVNGKKRDFSIDDPLMFESMQALGGSGAEKMLTSIVGAPSKFLREAITRDPGFMIVNMMRDTLSSYVTSGASFIPVYDTIKNARSGAEALSAYGVVGGYDFSADPENLFDDFQREMSKRGMGEKSGNMITKPFIALWDGLGKATTMSDAATRKAVFDDVLARTGNEAEAAYQALEVINFSRRGNSPSARIITAAIPFLNARFQGLDVFWRAASGKYNANKEFSKRKQQQVFTARAIALASLTGLYWMLFSDDEQYKEADEFTRDNNWLIPTDSGVPVKIPIPFEVGLLFKTIPEKSLAVLSGKATGREAMQSAVTGVTGTLAINPLGAQIVKPLVEAGFNYNFYTGNAIVSKYLDGNLQDAFIDRSTSNQLAKTVGEMFDVSPLKVEHVMRGYTGTMGTYVLGMVDEILRHPALTGDNELQMPSRPVTEFPIIKRFFANSKNAGAKEDFYELNAEIRKIVGTLNALKKEGRTDVYRKYLQGREHLLGMKNNVNYVADRLSKIRKRRDQVMRSNLSPDEKRKIIDRLQEVERDTLKVTSVLKKKANLPVIDTLYR